MDIKKIMKLFVFIVISYIFVIINKVYCIVTVTVQSPINTTYYINKINLTYNVTSDNNTYANVYIYLDGILIDQKTSVPIPYTNTTILEINKEGLHNVTVYAIGLNSSETDVKTVLFNLHLYDVNVSYFNYTTYNNKRYVDTLDYLLKVRCGVLGYNITILANFTDGNKTINVICNNTTYVINGTFRFTNEGIKTTWFYLNAINSSDSKYFGVNNFIADLNPPIITSDYKVTAENKLGLGIVAVDTISPFVICTAKLGNNYIVKNKTLIPNIPAIFILPLEEYAGFHKLTVNCTDIVGHKAYSSMLVSIAPNLLKTLEWDYPDEYYVDQDAKIIGTLTVINVGVAPILQPVTETLPYIYGKNLVVYVKETGEKILSSNLWSGPLNIEIKDIPPGKKKTYVIEYEIPTVKTISKRKYFIIEGGIKYNVIEMTVISRAPIMLNRVYYKQNIEDCSVVSKAYVDNSKTTFTCHGHVLKVYLGSFTPSEQKTVKIYMKGAPVLPKRRNITIQIPERVQDLINYISNMINGAVNYLQDMINKITGYFSSIEFSLH